MSEEEKKWGEYEVYEMINGEKHRLALCHDYKIADIITQLLAFKDPTGDSYYFTTVPAPTDFVPGGGWYEEYHMENGKLKTRSLG